MKIDFQFSEDPAEQEDIEKHIQKTKDAMTKRCKDNIARIHRKCAYEGESFSDHKECYEASKEWIRYQSFPSCISD